MTLRIAQVSQLYNKHSVKLLVSWAADANTLPISGNQFVVEQDYHLCWLMQAQRNCDQFRAAETHALVGV